MITQASRKNTSPGLRISLAIVALCVINAPMAATEEVIVTGAQTTAEAHAENARFRNNMDLFTKTVELRFKADLEFDLKQSVTPPLRLASTLTNNRG